MQSSIESQLSYYQALQESFNNEDNPLINFEVKKNPEFTGLEVPKYQTVEDILRYLKIPKMVRTSKDRLKIINRDNKAEDKKEEENAIKNMRKVVKKQILKGGNK